MTCRMTEVLSRNHLRRSLSYCAFFLIEEQNKYLLHLLAKKRVSFQSCEGEILTGKSALHLHCMCLCALFILHLSDTSHCPLTSRCGALPARVRANINPPPKKIMYGWGCFKEKGKEKWIRLTNRSALCASHASAAVSRQDTRAVAMVSYHSSPTGRKWPDSLPVLTLHLLAKRRVPFQSSFEAEEGSFGLNRQQSMWERVGADFGAMLFPFFARPKEKGFKKENNSTFLCVCNLLQKGA